MMITYNDPDTDMGEFYNGILGRPYIGAENRLTLSDVYSCCTHDRMLMGHPGPCAMGIDNDDEKRIVIGYRSGKKYVIVKVLRTSDKTDIDDLIRRFNVRQVVIDALPNHDSARELWEKYRGKVFLRTSPENRRCLGYEDGQRQGQSQRHIRRDASPCHGRLFGDTGEVF